MRQYRLRRELCLFSVSDRQYNQLANVGLNRDGQSPYVLAAMMTILLWLTRTELGSKRITAATLHTSTKILRPALTNLGLAQSSDGNVQEPGIHTTYTHSHRWRNGLNIDCFSQFSFPYTHTKHPLSLTPHLRPLHQTRQTNRTTDLLHNNRPYLARLEMEKSISPLFISFTCTHESINLCTTSDFPYIYSIDNRLPVRIHFSCRRAHKWNTHAAREIWKLVIIIALVITSIFSCITIALPPHLFHYHFIYRIYIF